MIAIKESRDIEPLFGNGTQYLEISECIKETFKAIDRFEWQLCDELLKMRDECIFKQGGYKSFEEYCETELTEWGGYRRVNQLLGAKKVIDTLQETQFSGVVTKERQARTLLRLVKSPEKLQEAISIACQSNPHPTSSEIAKAVKQVQEPRFLGEQSCNPPQERTPAPRTYSEDELEQAIARAIAEAKLGFYSELEATAQSSVQEQLAAAQELAAKKAAETVALQQRINELESLYSLKEENKILRKRIEELETAIASKPAQEWNNTFNKQAEKVLNKEVKKILQDAEQWDIRLLCDSPPPKNPDYITRLLGLSLETLSQELPNKANELRKAAAIVLGVDEKILTDKSSQLRRFDIALREIRQILASPYATSEELNSIADQYKLIRDEIWEFLTQNERLTFNKLEAEYRSQEIQIEVGSKVSHSDKFNTLYLRQGVVVGFENGNFLVHWDGYDQPLFRHRYEPNELRLV